MKYSRELDEIQQRENDGMGVREASKIVRQLERGNIYGAQELAHRNWDKFENHQNIKQWLYDNELKDCQSTQPML